MRRSPRPVRGAATAALLALAVTAAGCGEEVTYVGTSDVPGPAPTGPSATAPTTADDDVPDGDAPEEACPPSFTEGRSGNAVAFEPDALTGDAPTWVCRYESEPGTAAEAWLSWRLAAVPARVTEQHRERVLAFAAGLTPTLDGRAPCDADPGTRLLLAHEVRDGEQAHAVVDELGCGDVRLAENLAVDTLAFSAPTWRAAEGTVRALAELVSQE